MGNNTIKEVRKKDVAGLRAELVALRKEQFNLRFQRASGQLENTSRVRVVRKDIARIQTILGEWTRNPEAAGKAPAAKKEKAAKADKKAAAPKAEKAEAEPKAAKEKAPAKKRAKKE